MALAGAGKTTGAVLAGLLCLGLFLFAIAAVVVLSLISVYTPSSDIIGAGDEFQMDPVTLKFLYTNETYNFTNGTIADSSALSTACTTALENTGNQEIAGCVLYSNFGYGPYNDSTVTRRRRRSFGLSGLYSFGKARIFFRTTCGKNGDKGKYIDNTHLSQCVKRRLTACNAFFKLNAADLAEWAPLPTPFSISIVEYFLSNYIPLAVSKLFVVGSTTANLIASNFGNNNIFINDRGCRYIGPITRSQIAAVIASQSVATTTLPPTTPPQAPG